MTERAEKGHKAEDLEASKKAASATEAVHKDKKGKPVSSEDPSSEPEELRNAFEAKAAEAKENYDRFLRSAAELENYKKRSARQMEEFRKFANESLLPELLPVIDNLERAMEAAAADEDSNAGLLEGVRMTMDEIKRILDKFGVKPIDALERSFDPAYHQAVMQEEAEHFPAQTVIRELQKGYLLHDRLLRPAMVVVSRLPSTLEEQK